MIDFPGIKRRIKTARRAKGMTAEEAADKLGVSFQAIYKWENVGNTYPTALPTVDHIVDLCELYGVSAE